MSGGMDRDIPWPTFLGLLECSVYGGRVDHPEDTRVLRAILASVMHWDVIGGKRPPALGAPLCPTSPSTTQGDCMALVATLPTYDPPSLLGLPDNVHITKGWAMHQALLLCLKTLRNGGSGSGGGSGGGAPSSTHDSADMDIPALLTALTTLGGLWPSERGGSSNGAPSAAAHDGSSEGGGDGAGGKKGRFCPIAAVIARENTTSRRLAATVEEDLESLRRVVAASSSASSASSSILPRTRALAVSIVGDITPEGWEGVWSGGEGGVVEWLRCVAGRKRATDERWRALSGLTPTGGGEGSSSGASKQYLTPSLSYLLSSPLRFSTFFHPQALLTALRQATSRAYVEGGLSTGSGGGCGVADLRLVAVCSPVTPALMAPLEQACKGVLVPLVATGIQVQGAVWNEGGGVLSPPSPDSPVLTTLPPIHFLWLPPFAPDPYPPTTVTRLPLYTSLARKHTLAHVALPCGGGEKGGDSIGKAWPSLCGAALFS